MRVRLAPPLPPPRRLHSPVSGSAATATARCCAGCDAAAKLAPRAPTARAGPPPYLVASPSLCSDSAPTPPWPAGSLRPTRSAAAPARPQLHAVGAMRPTSLALVVLVLPRVPLHRTPRHLHRLLARLPCCSPPTPPAAVAPPLPPPAAAFPPSRSASSSSFSAARSPSRAAQPAGALHHRRSSRVRLSATHPASSDLRLPPHRLVLLARRRAAPQPTLSPSSSTRSPAQRTERCLARRDLPRRRGGTALQLVRHRRAAIYIICYVRAASGGRGRVQERRVARGAGREGEGRFSVSKCCFATVPLPLLLKKLPCGRLPRGGCHRFGGARHGRAPFGARLSVCIL